MIKNITYEKNGKANYRVKCIHVIFQLYVKKSYTSLRMKYAFSNTSD